MTLGEKIRETRKAKGLSLRDFEKKLREIFGGRALRYNTLFRIEKGLRDPRVSSLAQICLGLGISLKELEEGTKQETSGLVDHIKKGDKTAQYLYSEKAHAEILTPDKRAFVVLKLLLEPGAQTKPERDPGELGPFEKWIYGLKGKFDCVVGEERFTVGRGESISFDSSLPHFFENNTPQKAACLIIQNPKHL